MRFFHLSSLPALFLALAHWPLEWARGLVERQRVAGRRAVALGGTPSCENATGLANSLRTLQASGLAIGFDIARSQYAAGVQAGLIERSLLASGAFERRLGQLERLTLGPWARAV